MTRGSAACLFACSPLYPNPWIDATSLSPPYLLRTRMSRRRNLYSRTFFYAGNDYSSIVWSWQQQHYPLPEIFSLFKEKGWEGKEKEKEKKKKRYKDKKKKEENSQAPLWSSPKSISALTTRRLVLLHHVSLPSSFIHLDPFFFS